LDVAAGAVVLGVAEVVGAVDLPKLPNRGGAAAGAEVEAEVDGVVAPVPPESPANKLGAAGAAEDVATPNGVVLTAGAALVVDAWVAGVLAAG
jgi:hypothetical protein